MRTISFAAMFASGCGLGQRRSPAEVLRLASPKAPTQSMRDEYDGERTNTRVARAERPKARVAMIRNMAAERRGENDVVAKLRAAHYGRSARDNGSVVHET